MRHFPSRREFVALSVLSTLGIPAMAQEKIKLGFLVKMPEEPWFINEQKAAEDLAKSAGVEVIRMGTPDGEKVMAAIDNLGAQGAKGFVICAPDVRLGAAIWARAKRYQMKVISVDDQLLDSNAKPMAEIPHLGMSGYKIGQQVGDAIAAEMKRRGWKPSEVAALRLSNNELPTAKERTDGATDSLLKAGFLAANVFETPQKSTDTESALTAAMAQLSKNAGFKKWVVYSLNENTVVGGVRATEQLKIPATNVIGVGIAGTTVAFNEFSRKEPTGFFATVAVSSVQHGIETTRYLHDWVVNNKVPPANTATSGRLMTRENWQQLKTELKL